MSDPEVIIVGAGLAGLCCVLRLKEAGISSQILEAADEVGGRVGTDKVDGFLLDRGFQVLLTAYPESQRVLDYEDLGLARFEPGALVRYRGKFHRLTDPWRRPQYFLSTLISPLASLSDKLRLAGLRRQVCRGSLDELYARPETSTHNMLCNSGFSDRIIERFFRPFLGGVFLDSELQTSSRMFEFVFRMFAQGEAALPTDGMAGIARQIAKKLPSNAIRTETKVKGIQGNSIQTADGQQLSARKIVVACEAPAAAKLFGETNSNTFHGVRCLYFAADQPPVREPILVLNGEGCGPINNLCVPSQVCPNYAPANQSLISVTVLDKAGGGQENVLQAQVLQQLREWFGAVVDRWRHLKTYHIPYALPDQAPPALSPVAKPVERSDGILVCGDYCDTASINGAMISGRRAAERIIGQA